VRRAAAVLLGALAALAAPRAASAGEPSAAEARLRTEAAEALAGWAGRCAAAGARAEGEAAAAEAKGLDHLAEGVHDAESALASPGADGGDAAALAALRRSAAAAVAKVYDRLAALPRDKADEPRFEGYLLAAARWEPTDGRRKRILSAVEAAAGAGRPEAAGRLLAGAERLDPEGSAKGKYDALAQSLAAKDLLAMGSPGHDLIGWVSLPRGWTKGKSWPMLLGVEGAGCGFAGYCRGLATARGSRPFIVVIPFSFSNTNSPFAPAKWPVYAPDLVQRWDAAAAPRTDFDGPGALALLDAVRRRFGGEEKVFVTGFSGGGNLAYWMLIRHPERVRGAAPACANFSGMGLDGAPGAGPGGGPPVHLLTGEKDPHRDFTFGDKNQPGIEPQTDRAVEALKGLGYTRIERTLVKGAGHAALADQVWRFVDGVLGSK